MTEREQMTPGMSLLHSALAPERDTGPALEWLSERERASHFRVRRIPFGSFDQWSFLTRTQTTSCIVRASSFASWGFECEPTLVR